VLTASGLEPRFISVAHRNDEVTAVASGLTPGERVALAPPPDADDQHAALEGGTP